MTRKHPPGATLHLGGDAWAHPTLEPLLVPITQVHPYPGNPRRGDQPAITASIHDLGLYAGVITQHRPRSATQPILVGNHRHAALIELGAERIPRTVLKVTDERAAAIVARDNLTSDKGGYDDRALLALLTGTDDVLALSGYGDGDLDALRRSVELLDFADTAHEALGVPLAEVAGPIDLDGDAEKVTITLDPGHRPELYRLLHELPWVRNITDAHVKAPQ